MGEKLLPPIHDTARLWHRTEVATLNACIAYRRRQRPGWTLSWLRENAVHILNGDIAETALRHSISQYVPPESRKSILHALELLLRFVRKYQWQGIELPTHDVPVGRGFILRVRPVGVFLSRTKGRKVAIALQPRLDYAPNDEQNRIWFSAVHYEFCCDPLDPLETMIVDLSKDATSGKRRLLELTSPKIAILPKKEFDERLDLIATCYEKAIDLVPELPAKPPKPKDPNQTELF